MSGPKCSNFVLSEERRLEELRKIEEQLREEEEGRRLEEQRRLEEEARQRAIEKENARIEHNEDFNRRMEERRAKRKEKLLRKREQEIMAEAIDEAMVELGYDLIAAVKPKEEENSVHAQLFSFADGVGVQVIESGERISMEVVGLGTNNRRPTEAEGEYLEKQMVDFCDVYTKLEEKLNEKGIVKKNMIHHLPPNKKYARILNMENFEQKKEAITLQTIMRKSVKKTRDDMQIEKKKQTEIRME